MKEIPKHAHLRFFTKDGENVLSFVDYRRFGSWTVNGEWGSGMILLVWFGLEFHQFSGRFSMICAYFYNKIYLIYRVTILI